MSLPYADLEHEEIIATKLHHVSRKCKERTLILTVRIYV